MIRMMGIGTPSSQSSIPRPMSASFLISVLIVAPSKRASIRFVPAKHTPALDYFSNIGMSEVLLTAPATLLPDFLIACPASPGLQGAN